MGPDDFVVSCFGIVLLGTIGVLVAAFLTARNARSEVETLRRELDRLDRILKVVVDRTARIEQGMKGASPPPSSGGVVERPPAAAPGDVADRPRQQAPPPPQPEAPPPHLLTREERLRRLREEAASPGAAPEPAAAGEPAPYPVTVIPDRPSSEVLSLESFLGGRVFLVAGVVFAVLGLGWFLKLAIDRNMIGPELRVLLGAAAGIAALVGGDRLRAKGWTVYGHGIMGGGLAALFVTTYFASVRYGFLDRTAGSAGMALLTAAGAGLAVWREAPLLAYLGFLGGFLAPGLLSTGEDRLLALAGWLSVMDSGVISVTVRRRWHGLDVMAVAFAAIYFGAWTDRFYDPSRAAEATGILSLLVALGLATALGPPLVRREPPAPTALFASFLAGLLGTMGAAALLWPDHRRALGIGLVGLAGVYAGSAHLVASRCGARREAGTLLALGLAALAASVPFVFEGRGIAPAWAAIGLALLVLAARGANEVVAWGGTLTVLLGAAEGIFGGRWQHRPGFDPFLNAAFLSMLAPVAALVAGGLVLRRSREGLMPGFLLVAGNWCLAFVLGAEAWESAHDLRREPGFRPETLEAAAAAAGVAGAALAAVIAWRREEISIRVLSALPLGAALILGLFWIAGGHGKEFEPVFNGGFGLCAFAAAATFVAGIFLEDGWEKACQVAALAFVFVLGTGEIFQWGRWCPLEGGIRQDAEFRAQVFASVAWALYASALLVLGFLRERADFRWSGIVLFGITAAKVFLFDMSQLDVAYRIGSFVVLGLLLVAASFLYQRRKAVPG